MREDNELVGLGEVSEYAKVCRQAIYLAIRKGNLKGTRQLKKLSNGTTRKLWVIKKEDVDAYRANKYSRDKRMHNGEKLFDIANDKWSVLHAAKALSAVLGYPYHTSRIYYLLRTGKLKGKKLGSAWVISRDALITIYESEATKDDKQLRMI